MHSLELPEKGNVPGGWILEIVARQPDMLEGTLFVTPNPPSSWDSCKRMSTQTRSCWFHVL